jgi:hypothetical protein
MKYRDDFPEKQDAEKKSSRYTEDQPCRKSGGLPDNATVEQILSGYFSKRKQAGGESGTRSTEELAESLENAILADEARCTTQPRRVLKDVLTALDFLERRASSVLTRLEDNNASNLEWALAYAELGWRVLPCHTIENGKCTCGKSKCETPGKHPRIKKWSKASSSNPETIRKWFKRWPDANIAIHWKQSGLIALDVDPRNGGLISLRQLVADFELEPTAVQVSGSGCGVHVVYKVPKGARFPRKPKKYPGIDFQYNGISIVPPSVHISGGEYYWKRDPFDGRIKNAADWLLGLRDKLLSEDGKAKRVYSTKPESAIDAINQLALQNIPAWAPDAFPEGHWEGDSDTWKIRADELDRESTNAISIHPTGIKDFGLPDGKDGLRPHWLIRRHFRAVDGVIDLDDPIEMPWSKEDWLDLTTHPQGCGDEEACLWLAERLGVDWEALKSKYGLAAKFEKYDDAVTFEEVLGELDRHDLTYDEAIEIAAGLETPGESEMLTVTTQIREIAKKQHLEATKASIKKDIKAATERTKAEKTELAAKGLDAEHAVININGKIRILYERTKGFIDAEDNKLTLTFDLMDENDFLLLHGRLDYAMEWLYSRNRREYLNGIIFAPGKKKTPGFYNLWKGFAIEPNKTGSCKRFIDHLRRNVCQSNDAYLYYVLGWMAHIIQKPQEKPGVALVLRGLKGVGKSIIGVVLGVLLGRHYTMIDKREQLTGRFNAYMENALLVMAEEVFWSGDPAAESVLKSNITSETTRIERKGIDSFHIRNYTRFIICSNADWVVPATPDERRFAVFDVGDGNKQDTEFFGEMLAELKDGGYGRLLHMLQTMDLSDFDVRDVPQTEGLAQQKLASQTIFEKFIRQELQSGELWSDRDDTPEIAKDGLFESYMEFERRFKCSPIVLEQFSKKLLGMFPVISKTRPRRNGVRVYAFAFPTLSLMREAFDKRLGHTTTWDKPNYRQSRLKY